MAVVFLTQATNTPLDLSLQIALLCRAPLLTSGIRCSCRGWLYPLPPRSRQFPAFRSGRSQLVGVDRFMGEGRAIATCRNGIAALAVSKWEGELPAGTLKQRLNALAAPQSRLLDMMAWGP